jgi:hypothetical protein
MIRSLNGGRHLQVTSGSPPPTYVSPIPGALNVGQIRYNTNNQALEVYDGSTWNNLHQGFASVEMTAEAAAAIDWASNKMREEAKLKEMMEKHPGLKDLYEKFEILKLLCEQEEENGAC